MSTNNNDEKMNNKENEKKNFTEILSDKAEKAGEATADAVNHFTEMLTNKDKNDSKDEVDLNTGDNKESSHTCKLKEFMKSDDFKGKELNATSKFKMYFVNSMLVVYDLFAVSLSYFLALWFRFDGEFSQIPPRYLTPYLEF
ncbi:MAG: hypothetical protein J6M65_00840, partial [Eubacterium sp.]|nr:hypothetical protein [Eubacterium sp.]